MLRLALLENLRRVAAHLAAGRRDRDSANDWAERMAAVVEKNPSSLIIVLADMARANPPFTSAFLAELTRHLHGQSPHYAFAQSWLEHRISEQGLRLGPLVQMESQVQAADQVSIGNSVTSLRFLSSTDWKEFVEEHSVVEQTLRTDPAGVYADMDFRTRDRYRHAVEEIARQSQLSEIEVARKTIAVAGSGPGGLSTHVGFHLIGNARRALDRAAGVRRPVRVIAGRIFRQFPLLFYLFGVALVTAGITTLWPDQVQRLGLRRWALFLLAVPVLMCAVQIGIGVINWLATALVGPRPLPRMDFSDGIPPENRTIVVVPTMLRSAASVQSLVSALEIRYLANADKNLHFALLTDLGDAPQEVMPGDAELISHAREGIESLAETYGQERNDIFFLFHRPRRWNAADGLWMGRERKRGKLEEFNDFLLHGSRQHFAEIVGDTTKLRDVRYVITLDTDTELPRDSASVMVGTMAHPLNRPVFDHKRRRVVEGYGILQPRVGISLPSAGRSWFVRLFAADAGLDPYTRVVSDVYQDLFCEGSFIGKGIYDVAAFEATCSGFPDNAILSHDLLEGAYARSALISDVELYEDHPARYGADVSRRRRWIRGDWQIAYWLLPRVPGRDSRWAPNPISALSRWKILDNLRRSLVPVAMLMLLLCGWIVWPGLAPAATLLVVATVAAAPLLVMLVGLVRKPAELPWLIHFGSSVTPIARQLAQILFSLAFLPYEAFVSADAIARTLGRMFWTRRCLLEWQTSSDAHRAARGGLVDTYVSMWGVTALSVAIFAVTAVRQPHVVTFAPLLGLWLLSPAIAWWFSRTIPAQAPRLTESQVTFLHSLSRRTWRYFEVFVTAQENWLPPDNFQEEPHPVIAARTSPTNIGMALLANLSAYDFGYLSAAQLLDRTEKTLSTMARMERFRGHFYNWYDTRTLRPLPPKYVSTVDSGNLMGHLLVLRRGLIGIAEEPIVSKRACAGIDDTLGVLLDVAHGLAATAALPRPDVIRKLEDIRADLRLAPKTLTGLNHLLHRVRDTATDITAIEVGDTQFQWWASALLRAAHDHQEDLAFLAPWTSLAALPAADTLDASQQQRLNDALSRLETVPTLAEVATLQPQLEPMIEALLIDGAGMSDSLRSWLQDFRRRIVEASNRAADRIRAMEDAAARCYEFADVDVSLLYDKTKDLFTIGYNATDLRSDVGYYDLLASECRLISFVAIAQGQLNQTHWFALGRLLTTARGNPSLLSWSGSMFEYLMPLLVMPTYENTLLDRTYKAVVRRQIDYGKQRGVPWGISESGYNATDAQLNYQYHAFGVPGLGLKRGLAEDVVIAPYATVMALMVAPEAACRNLERLATDGRMGDYGFYEAVDYTPSRLTRGQTSATVQSFMAHHEGMSFLSLAYVLLDRPMQRRFDADPMLRATDLLLQERVPRAVAPVFPHSTEAATTRSGSVETEQKMRIFTDPNGLTPAVNLLSNGQYHVMITSAGGGYSRWRDLAVTRWREDATRDCWGTYCYLRDVNSERFWSTSHQPTLRPTRNYEAIFSQARAEFRRLDNGIETHTDISVSPEDDIELRRVTITNRSAEPRAIEVTTYAEVVLAPSAQDLSHPAFSNLFVQTELVRERHAILCTRRPRSASERPPWMLHLISVHGGTTDETSFETDRMKFIGRGRTSAAPQAMDRGGKLTDTQGSVLDPVVSIRRVVNLSPGEVARVDIVTGVSETRDGARALIDKYDDPRLAARVCELAWTHSHVQMRQLGVSEASAQLYCQLAGSLVYATSRRRASASILGRNRRGQSSLWGHGVSGDLPILLLRIRDRTKLDLVSEAVQAHAYWRMRGLLIDLVVWNEDDSVYRQSLHDMIMDTFAGSHEASLIAKPGGLFIVRGEQMSDDDRVLLQSVARVVLFDDAGTLREQVERRERSEPTAPLLKPSRRRVESMTRAETPKRDLAFFNGLGGFTQDGREYVTLLAPGQNTPAPWSNVIANEQFGTVVSESGTEYTWAENCHEFRLTTWNNDPVSGGNSEGFYIRDEETGRFWSPSPHPVRGEMPYIIRHGFGYTIFEYEEDGIFTELTIYVATDAPVKFSRFKIINRSGRPRRISITGYWELVLGELRHKTSMHVVTEIDPITNALFARNAYNTEFAGRVVFADSSETVRTFTGDRTDFVGRNGSAGSPAALGQVRLSGRVGAGLDPCAALQVRIALEANQEKEISFSFGSAGSDAHARELIQRHRSAFAAQRALEGVWHYWSRTLGVMYVETPDPSVNFLANGWLLYQTLACRMWARTGFYQSGGAYGFRDQLQDAMALLHAEPGILRQQLIRAAARQFREGDVQHWWHPPQGRGVRT
ncbi:MAG: cyclic beta 1-2 glucan synthetase, partial [Burkholderiales bacterium]|nr:cyclic beta 1-2 glucan synthetase [Phycisphaerae bacterium]